MGSRPRWASEVFMRILEPVTENASITVTATGASVAGALVCAPASAPAANASKAAIQEVFRTIEFGFFIAFEVFWVVSGFVAFGGEDLGGGFESWVASRIIDTAPVFSSSTGKRPVFTTRRARASRAVNSPFAAFLLHAAHSRHNIND